MDSDVREKTDIFAETKIQEPKRYKVIFFNDDYTTKDFVVDVLKKLYHKNESEAIFIMEQVHQKGSAVVGVYTYDIALTRVEMTISLARKNGFPLRCEMPED